MLTVLLLLWSKSVFHPSSSCLRTASRHAQLKWPTAFFVVADFQKAAALIHEFQLKLSEEGECAELRDALNLALLHMQRYYRYLRSRITSQEKVNGQILTTSLRGLSPMTPFKDAPDRFQWKWVNLDSSRLRDTLPPDVQKDMILPPLLKACKEGDNAMVMQVLDQGEMWYTCIW